MSEKFIHRYRRTGGRQLAAVPIKESIMKDFVYLPPMWWYAYGIGAYMALMDRLLTSVPQPVLDKDDQNER